MSHQPPSDPLQPDRPSQPHGPGPSDDRQVSGQPWSSPSGDPLVEDPARPTDPAGPTDPALPAGPRPPLPGREYAAPQYGPAPPGYGDPGHGDPRYGDRGHGNPGHGDLGYGDPRYGDPRYGDPDYGDPRYGDPGHGPPPPPPRKSNIPLIAVILAVTVLLCGGVVTTGVLVVQTFTDRVKEAVQPITDPSLPALPTEVPNLPTDLPGLPTDLPDLPTDLPTDLPDLPGVPNSHTTITVVYEVTGDGPAEIVYAEKLGEAPKRVSNAKLPWKVTATMEGATLVSVTAIRSGADSGTIGCRAMVDGKEVARGRREGAFATASCTKMILN